MWLYVIIGLFGGVLSGMGMGGGTILIPLATTFLSIKQIAAQGVNLCSFIPMAIVSIMIHIKNKLVRPKVGLLVILFAVVPALVGSLVANIINNVLLRKLFGVFLLIIGSFYIKSNIKDRNSKKLNNNEYKTKVKIHIWYN